MEENPTLSEIWHTSAIFPFGLGKRWSRRNIKDVGMEKYPSLSHNIESKDHSLYKR